ncbi:MAG: hybrid sensor histidine kinase/response regulator [Bacteroidales bacterium]|nr:hybrid sensor histidine kinase/response regulator [Bacteroidales bacterium]
MALQHILLVDDVAKNIQVAANILKQTGCTISFAQSGERALEILRKGPVDLVLLDVMMPGLDGYETCILIKNDRALSDIPVIFLTARDDPRSISQAFESGGIDYIAKPFNSEELLARVNTQLKLVQALKEIREQKEHLEKTNSVKDQLFSIVAHDLRNPFNGLMVMTEIMNYKLEQMNTTQIREMINLLYDASREGYLLLDNLLEWSRSQREEIEFKPVSVDIEVLIKGNLNLIYPLARTKGVEIETDFDGLPGIEADSHMLDIVIRNLLSNAIKFAPQKGKIEIVAYVKDLFIEFSVRDNGMGVPENIRETLFDPVRKSSTPGTANERGSGLGLILCKEFVERHKGKLWVETEPGKGSTFGFTLPINIEKFRAFS